MKSPTLAADWPASLAAEETREQIFQTSSHFASWEPRNQQRSKKEHTRPPTHRIPAGCSGWWRKDWCVCASSTRLPLYQADEIAGMHLLHPPPTHCISAQSDHHREQHDRAFHWHHPYTVQQPQSENAVQHKGLQVLPIIQCSFPADAVQGGK